MYVQCNFVSHPYVMYKVLPASFHLITMSLEIDLHL